MYVAYSNLALTWNSWTCVKSKHDQNINESTAERYFPSWQVPPNFYTYTYTYI